MASSPAASTSSAPSARSAAARSIEVAPATGAKVAHAAQQPPGDARRAARAPRDLVGAVGGHADAEHARAAVDDVLELGLGIEVEPDRDAEAVAQRIGEQARARGRADQRERREIDLHRARRRSLADDEVELEILHRRIEDLLHRRIEPVDLVDEQHVALFEIGEQRREVAGLGDHRAGGRAEVDAELARDDLRQRGLAEPGRADEQHVVERLVALARRLDEDAEIGARLLLPDEFGQPLRTKRSVRSIVVAAFGGHEPGGRAHAAAPLRSISDQMIQGLRELGEFSLPQEAGRVNRLVHVFNHARMVRDTHFQPLQQLLCVGGGERGQEQAGLGVRHGAACRPARSPPTGSRPA